MNVTFYKYHGAGNDFILIDNRTLGFNPDHVKVMKLCHRYFGIGADGLILLENHPDADFLMRYFNSDGREASMCGNGGRCIVAFARFLGLIDQKVNFVAFDGRHHAEMISTEGSVDHIKLKMNDVTGIQQFDEGYFADTGSPHLVRFAENLAALDVNSEGKRIRNLSKWGVDGVNVNFVEVKSGQLYSRTFERGVENETLACGTGSVAMALVSFHFGIVIKSPVVINATGGQLKVHFDAKDQQFVNVWLEGPAERVFQGTIRL